MEARDRLEEEVAGSRQALHSLQQKHDQLAADLEQVSSASAATRPEDAARIDQLSAQVNTPLMLLTSLCCLSSTNIDQRCCTHFYLGVTAVRLFSTSLDQGCCMHFYYSVTGGVSHVVCASDTI